MKYYSEILKKKFDTVEDLESAEKAHLEQENKSKVEKNQISKKKKELSVAYETAEEKLRLAQENYRSVLDECRELRKCVNQKIKENLEAARNEVENAEIESYNALNAFNREFGPYQKVYSGEKAEKEFKKISGMFDSIFNSFFNMF